MHRLIGLTVLLAGAALTAGCSTPSYRAPAGFSSSWHRGLYGDAVAATDPAPSPADGTAAPGQPRIEVSRSLGSLGSNSDLNSIRRW